MNSPKEIGFNWKVTHINVMRYLSKVAFYFEYNTYGSDCIDNFKKCDDEMVSV